MKHIQKKSGFTLIELLVVIVILGILSTISVGTFRSYFAKARDSERVSTAQNVAMMIKVDSGGAGDCGVYNYTGFDLPTGIAVCGDGVGTGLQGLLSENDYSMPDEKNGLAYYYGAHIGTVAGDNEFFVVIGAEEDVAQNGKPLTVAEGVSVPYVFADGTVKGILALTANAGGDDGCTWSTEGHKPVCGSEWRVFIINKDGTIGTSVPEGKVVGTAE